MAIKLYNTLTGRKEELVPRDEGKITIYVCGPTVYNYIHVGNARTFLNFDVIRRYLKYAGYEVTYVQNITDVDDKIINRAAEEGISAEEVAEKYARAFEEDMRDLGVRPPDIVPRATDHIDDMIAVIRVLVDGGFAYESGGDVYFDVLKFPDYGKLSGRSLDEQQVTSARTPEELERKRGPHDFALWKAAKPGEPSWRSPWGAGRPGWHIECSTMSVKYLGEGFDIHGGGKDLIFPHHENELAQAEAAGGRPFVRYWLHSGMLTIDQEKMSKSLGNIRRLREVLEVHDPDTVRMLMLGTHYRNPLNFSDESLQEAKASLERIVNCLFNVNDLLGRLGGEGVPGKGGPAGGALNRFREAMDDDFNSAAALGVIFGLVKEANNRVDKGVRAGGKAAGELAGVKSAIEEMCGALGLFQAGASSGEPGAQASVGGVGSARAAAGPAVEELESLLREMIDAAEERGSEGLAGRMRDGLGEAGGGEGVERSTPDGIVDLLLRARQAAREAKQFELADRIREGLASLGVRVEDVRDGFRWRYER